MKSAMLKKISGAVLAVLMMTVIVQIPVSAQNEPNDVKNAEAIMGDEHEKENSTRLRGGSNALEGSWNATATFRICATGAAIRSFPAMNTFMQGGTMQEFGVGSGLFRGPGHGVWQHLGGNNFYSTFQFFRFNPDGTPLDRVIVRQYIQVGILGDSYIASSTTEFRDLTSGNITLTGCATGVGTRFR